MPDRYSDPDGEVTDELWAAEQRRSVAAMQVVNCGLCDDEGRRGSRVCDHKFRSGDVRRAAMAEIRQILQKGRKA